MRVLRDVGRLTLVGIACELFLVPALIGMWVERHDSFYGCMAGIYALLLLRNVRDAAGEVRHAKAQRALQRFVAAARAQRDGVYR